MRLRASIWYCGDDVCECYQPVVELISPNGVYGFNFRRLWNGTFHSQPNSDELQEMEKQLLRAMEHYGIKNEGEEGSFFHGEIESSKALTLENWNFV